MKPRERCGQVSIASAAPAGHSAPMPMPRRVRNISSNQKLGARPANRLQTENQAIEIISGFLRPIRSASQPEAVAPISRIHNVRVKTMATSVSGTPKSLRNRHHQQQENGEVERIEGPPEPGGNPGEPLILGWFLPPGVRNHVGGAADMTRSPVYFFQRIQGFAGANRPIALCQWSAGLNAGIYGGCWCKKM